MQFKGGIKWVFISCALAFTIFIGYWIIILFSTGLFDSSSKVELIENYTNKEKEIIELKNYFNSIVPKNFSVYIEFKSDNKIDLKVYEGERNSNSENNGLFMQWDINPYDYTEKPKSKNYKSKYEPKTESLEYVKLKLKWTDNTFKKIKEMLDKANCISIENGEPSEIGFARSGMGKYSYTIYNKKIPNSLLDDYKIECENIIYNDKVVLTYGSGAFGSTCFPKSDLEK
ncbi:hypothetical protein J3S90_15605 [Flavobacterium sp. P4023]|uniref:Lipoprotein n=1 Tax=Flavobacterium flabelliforme TaxID=2816119 RepID=A0ABS5CX60_9FLAO|nr:hypothetical protein [Flavobacterium flabelliforme]MBP4143226.1 hypothetical protein [Flavobacterium flabelliforme]